MSRMQVLSDSEWVLIEPFMPCADGKRGRRFRDHRTVVEPIIYRYRTGIAWRDLPGEFGPWQTVWKRHRRFAGDGTWDRVLTALLARADAAGVIDWDVAVDSTINRAHQHATNTTRLAGGSSNHKNLLSEPADHAIGRSRGGLSTKVHQLCDGQGRPIVVLLGPGQGSDSRMFTNLLDAVRVPRPGPGRPRTTPDAVMADKACSSRAHRALLRRRGITTAIAEPRDQRANRKRRGSAGGRPPKTDPGLYAKRHVVENGFERFKQWRAIATRYDKLAITYRAGILLRAITLWLPALRDTP
ncbi:IS5 family transposase [Arsenicicoccus dermatophilus]|uniref:IS5 family transposase n=2 Tax=Arsenicicoccus dermatophilus TaxID=1076331 RepID=UPI0038915289